MKSLLDRLCDARESAVQDFCSEMKSLLPDWEQTNLRWSDRPRLGAFLNLTLQKGETEAYLRLFNDNLLLIKITSGKWQTVEDDEWREIPTIIRKWEDESNGVP